MSDGSIPLAWGPFWERLTKDEWHELFETSRLTGELLARYWRMSEWQGEMPGSILIEVNRRDVEKLARQLKKERRNERNRRPVRT